MSDTHIKIKPVVPKVQYTGNGVTTVFPYEFAIFDDSDMVVYFDDTVQESGYTVSGAGQTDGGNVTFSTAPANGVKITLIRNIAIERLTDFQEGGTFRPKNLNDEFDRQTAFIQQVEEELSRSVKTGPTSDLQPEEVLEQIKRVYPYIDEIDTVADDIANVNAVAGNSTNINTVASNNANITTVAGISSAVSTVASNSSKISTVSTNISSVNTVANNISYIIAAPVSAGGNNTFTGTNTFLDTSLYQKFTSAELGCYYLQNTAISKGTPPSANAGFGIRVQAGSTINASGRLASISAKYNTDGSTEINLQASKPVSGSEDVANISLIYPSSGTPYATAPASNVSNSILTTASISSSGTSFVKLGNGMIIQWGTATMDSNGSKQITLGTAFSDTNYRVITNPRSSTTQFYQAGCSKDSTTKFTIHSDYASQAIEWFVIGW